MRVICINDKPMFDPPEKEWLIKIGEVYEVVAAHKYNGFDYYELDIQPGVGYCVEHFIPLSEIDETELIHNYKTQLV